MHKNTVKKTIIVHTKVAASSNDSNARRAYTNKVATADEGDTRRTDVNIAITANVMASDARESANIVINTNVNKTTSNIRKRMPTYQAT